MTAHSRHPCYTTAAASTAATASAFKNKPLTVATIAAKAGCSKHHIKSREIKMIAEQKATISHLKKMLKSKDRTIMALEIDYQDAHERFEHEQNQNQLICEDNRYLDIKNQDLCCQLRELQDLLQLD